MARSDYFSAMLGGGWSESVTGEVVLQGYVKCFVNEQHPDFNKLHIRQHVQKL